MAIISKKLIEECPELVLEWHPIKNVGLKVEEITLKSGRKVWWKCQKGHEWERTISSRKNGSKCPQCRKNYEMRIIG